MIELARKSNKKTHRLSKKQLFLYVRSMRPLMKEVLGVNHGVDMDIKHRLLRTLSETLRDNNTQQHRLSSLDAIKAVLDALSCLIEGIDIYHEDKPLHIERGSPVSAFKPSLKLFKA